MCFYNKIPFSACSFLVTTTGVIYQICYAVPNTNRELKNISDKIDKLCKNENNGNYKQYK
jgi:hypothetical protein